MHCASSLRRPKADLAAVLFALVFPSLFTWGYFVGLARFPVAWQQVCYMLGKTIQFALPAVWVWGVQGRRLRSVWPGRAGVREGLAFGLAIFALALTLYHAWIKPAGWFSPLGPRVADKVAGFGVTGFWSFAALGAFYSVLHSLLEEYYWRWFVFGQLGQYLPWPVAVALSSVGFMAHHVIVLGTYFGWLSPATYMFSLAVAVGGAFWAWLYQTSRSLAGPWLSHLWIDAAIFAVGYDLVRPWLIR